MKTYLIVHRDRETGELGFLPEGVRLMDYPMVATQGLLVAHDLIEHQNGPRAIGGLWDELEALGASWWVRGQFNDLSRNGVGARYSPEENLGSDVANLSAIWEDLELSLATPPTTRAGDYEDGLQGIIEAAVKDARDNDRPMDPEFRRAAIHWMRSGLRKARRRWRGRAITANRTFWDIAQAVDRVINEIEYEGQRFLLARRSGYWYAEEIWEVWETGDSA